MNAHHICWLNQVHYWRDDTSWRDCLSMQRKHWVPWTFEDGEKWRRLVRDIYHSVHDPVVSLHIGASVELGSTGLYIDVPGENDDDGVHILIPVDIETLSITYRHSQADTLIRDLALLIAVSFPGRLCASWSTDTGHASHIALAPDPTALCGEGVGPEPKELRLSDVYHLQGLVGKYADKGWAKANRRLSEPQEGTGVGGPCNVD